MELDLVDISRWQFGITTVYHYIFVPLTMGPVSYTHLTLPTSDLV